MPRAAGSSKETPIDLDDSDDEIVCLGIGRVRPNVNRRRGSRRDIPIDLDEDNGADRKKRPIRVRRHGETPLQSLSHTGQAHQQSSVPVPRQMRSSRPPSIEQSYSSGSTSTYSFSEFLSRNLPIAVDQDEERFTTPASSVTLVDPGNPPISPLQKVKVEVLPVSLSTRASQKLHLYQKATPEPESYLDDEYEFDASLGPLQGGYVEAIDDTMDIDDESAQCEQNGGFLVEIRSRMRDAREIRSKAIPHWTRKPRTLLSKHVHWSAILMDHLPSAIMKERFSSVYSPAIEARRPKRGPLGRFSSFLNGSALRRSVHYAKTSGAITSIAQSGPNIVVASAVDGGMDDSGNLAYNRNKNLMVFRDQHSKILKGHQIKKNPSEGERDIDGDGDSDNEGDYIYYTVHDVAFDPTNENRFVSIGHEGKARVWDVRSEQLEERPDDSKDIANECLHEQDQATCRQRVNCTKIKKDCFVKATQSVAFQPDTSNFAVSCHDGTIHYIFGNRGRRILRLVKESNTEIAKPGHMLWASGSAHKSNRLYASTESSLDSHPCIHTAFDVGTSTIAYTLADEDSSDNMVLDPFDKRMALVSESKGTHRLSFFDVDRDDGRVTASIKLRRTRLFEGESLKLEVNDATFSPDGTLIALARNDNITDIYDTRFLNRIWATLPHARSSTVSRPVKDTFGVFGAHWVQGREWGSTGLVTGGADGCVRLWDVYRAPSHSDESTVLAELNHDVAHLTIGDPYKGEKRLIVGDCGGEVYIFD